MNGELAERLDRAFGIKSSKAFLRKLFASLSFPIFLLPASLAMAVPNDDNAVMASVIQVCKLRAVIQPLSFAPGRVDQTARSFHEIVRPEASFGSLYSDAFIRRLSSRNPVRH